MRYDDTSMSEDYRYCIKNLLPLPEEVITWFNDTVWEVADQEDIIVANAKFHVVSDYKLGYSPTQWARILKEENTARD